MRSGSGSPGNPPPNIPSPFGRFLLGSEKRNATSPSDSLFTPTPPKKGNPFHVSYLPACMVYISTWSIIPKAGSVVNNHGEFLSPLKDRVILTASTMAIHGLESLNGL